MVLQEILDEYKQEFCSAVLSMNLLVDSLLSLFFQ